MPGFAAPADHWVAQHLSQLTGDVAALKAQGTEYIVDKEGVCRAIVGHLVAEPNGTSTGLEGWGVAVKQAGVWLQVGAIDDRYLQLLAAANRKMAFGAAELEWSVKAFESASLAVNTGLTAAHFNYGQISATFGWLTTLSVVGGTVTWKARANEEVGAGVKRTMWWLAIE